MSPTRRAHDLLVMCRSALILVKSLIIVLMLLLFASHFHWRLVREAGGGVRQSARPARDASLTGRRA